MQFTSVQDINAPLDFVFTQLSDFESFEAYAMRVGAQVERRDNLTQPDAGLKWNFVGEVRGKTRTIDIELTRYERPTDLAFLCTSAGVLVVIEIGVMALTRKQTRIKISSDFKPQSISARLVMQSARLAKNSLNRKFNHRVWEFSNYVEANYNKQLQA